MAYKVIILYQLYMPSYFLGTFTEYPYEVIILGHLHMPLYFIGTFTEYPYLKKSNSRYFGKGQISSSTSSSSLSM